MKFQQTDFSCGAAAVINAFRALGVTISNERAVRRLCNTTKDGTDDFDVASGIVLMGYDVAKTQSREDVEFYLKQGCPVLVVSFANTHWTTVVGMLGDRWVVVDPDNAAWNKRENGCYVVPPTFLRTKEYLGIAIMDKHRRVPAKATSRSHRARPKRP